MPAKIAICFLITADVSNPQVWEEWWRGHEDKVSIYSHYSRGKEQNVTIPWLKLNRVKPVPTRWGDISLINAEAELYKKAYEKKYNTFFILVSGTCIPVRSFEYIYNRLMRSPKKGIMTWFKEDSYRVTDEDFEPFIKSSKCTPTLVSQKIVNSRLYSAQQWKILSRPNVVDFKAMVRDKIYMKMFQNCIRVVPDSLAPDEFMFVNYIKNKYGNITKVMRDGSVTFVDFKGNAVHPVTYHNITPKLRREICDIGSMFARKFPKYNPKLNKQLPVFCGKNREGKRRSYLRKKERLVSKKGHIRCINGVRYKDGKCRQKRRSRKRSRRKKYKRRSASRRKSQRRSRKRRTKKSR